MKELRKQWWEYSARLSAEFAIVVIGVTIALWADSWVANRDDREEESARLYALQDNITETLEALREERDISAAAADTLRKLLSKQKFGEDELRKLLRFGILYGPVFSPELNVYDDLKNSGELALLTDRDVRQSLATMDSRLAIYQMAQSDLASVQQLQIDSYAIDHADVRLLYGEDLGIEWVADDAEHDYEFMADKRFQNRILLKLDLISEVVIRFNDAEAALEKARQTIAAQLATEN